MSNKEHLRYQICTRCILDTTVSDIVFDIDGVCNYCHDYDKIISTIPSQERSDEILRRIVNEIKSDGKNKEYDCIIGMSGGVDSTYLAYKIVELGLRPLVVHVDTGWNSEIAVSNIENAVKKLNLDLYTYVVDWEEMASLQLAYFKASVVDCDVPQDHVFPAVLYKIASQKGIKHLISGHNLVTEFILPRPWSYDSNDLRNLKDINRRFGVRKLKKYPQLNLFNRVVYYRSIKGIRSHRFLYYIPFNKTLAKSFISENLGWRDYGGKHYESKFTKFFQAYYLPRKFNIDKRRAHLSNLILSNQITRQEALDELNRPLYSEKELEEDIDYVIRKLGITRNEWDAIMDAPGRSHAEFKTDKDVWWFKFLKAFRK